MPRAPSGGCVQCRRASSSATKTNSAVAWSSGSAGRSGARHWPRYPILSHVGRSPPISRIGGPRCCSPPRAEKAEATSARDAAASSGAQRSCRHGCARARAPIRLRHPVIYSLQGMTGPLRELMLWSTQDDAGGSRRSFRKEAHTTKVMLLDDFSSLGWSDFATCERRSTGGWATSEALFAVRPRYATIDDEEFRVSFLGHETQHFADYERFPGLPQWELEYRAKLTELALRPTRPAPTCCANSTKIRGRSGLAACLCQQARAGGTSPASRPSGGRAARCGRRCRPAGRGGRRIARGLAAARGARASGELG